MSTLYGYLHTWIETARAEPKERTDDLQEILLNKHEFKKISSNLAIKARNWESFYFFSNTPLTKEDIRSNASGLKMDSNFPYAFHVYINPHTKNVLISSELFSITNLIVDRLNFYLISGLSRVSFDVQKILQFSLDGSLLHREKRAFVSMLSMDVDDYGSKLQSISLFGSDLADSGFFAKFNSLGFSCRQIGLVMPSESVETARFQSGGGITFYSERLRGLTDTLGLISSIGATRRNL